MSEIGINNLDAYVDTYLEKPVSVDQWAECILGCWRVSVLGIIETGRLLAEAKKQLDKDQWTGLRAKLPLGECTVNRLILIAADSRISNRQHVPMLPPHWGTLYEISRLDDDAFNQCIESGVINPDMERKDIAGSIKRRTRERREEALGAKQQALPKKKFGVILADPEWRFEPWSRETGMDRAADNHYPTSALEVIKSRDVPSIAADDCVLFLWATAPMLPQALAVMQAWGFEYKSHCVWLKDAYGTGYWFRNCHELLLVGTKGKIPAPAMGEQEASVIDSPRTKHSAKPPIFLEIIEQMFPNLPKIELNRRGLSRPGWSAWGLEAEKAA